jgi:hypothetical protein
MPALPSFPLPLGEGFRVRVPPHQRADSPLYLKNTSRVDRLEAYRPRAFPPCLFALKPPEGADQR